MAVTVSEHRASRSRSKLALKLPGLAAFFDGLRRFSRSLVTKLILLLFVFLAMPAALYIEFQKADAEKQALLLESLREQGRLIAENLEPLLQLEGSQPLTELPKAVAKLATVQTGVKVLFLPRAESGVEDFYFVAAEPPVPPATLEEERQRLIERGVLDKLVETCEGNAPIALRHKTAEGQEELLTSISPVTTESGCWVVVTAHASGAFLGTSIGQPYWKTWEVRVAAMIYVGIALLTIVIFFGIWRNLMRFRNLARGISIGKAPVEGFVTANRVPELSVVAEELDRMTRSLQDSADDIRRASEDNAHAFKTPIAITRQSLEPLRRIVPEDNSRGQRALEVIEKSLDRLDHLVASSRELDETVAELLDPPRELVDLSRLASRLLSSYQEPAVSRNLRIRADLQQGVVVRASEDLLETVLENVIDNAISVSKSGGDIQVDLKIYGRQAVLSVRDRGPGVPAQHLERIFERYVSLRAEAEAEYQGRDEDGQHRGIGLWIVRRNLEAVGGGVRAENAPGGGLRVIVRLPLSR
ncbi:MAG: HAMP domain-containing sensor histidine kinase [Rhodovibrionaceae bacterium]